MGEERVNAGLVLRIGGEKLQLSVLLRNSVVAVDGHSSERIAIPANSKLQESIVPYIRYKENAGKAGEGQRDVSLQHGASDYGNSQKKIECSKPRGCPMSQEFRIRSSREPVANSRRQ